MNVGLPRDVAWRGVTVHTGVWKQAVVGPRWVRRLNVEGDGQGDLAGHGGENRAVLVYQIASYRYWQQELGREDFVHGQFGENFTVDGLPDDKVCIGDCYRIGDAVFEVTQPRVTCYRVGLRMNEPRMAALLVAHRRPGFYMRVLTEGQVQTGDEIVKIAAGPERVSVAEIDALLYLPGHSRERLARAVSSPALSVGWRISLRALLDQPGGSGGRVAGNPGLTEAGDTLEVAAPRDTFALRPGDTPVLLLSAGVGATPVLAMLHLLAAERATRQVWWLHGARDGTEHPFAEEIRALLVVLPSAHSHVWYSRPGPGDVQGRDYGTVGRLSADQFGQLGVPGDADAYLCGPTAFMQELTTGLVVFGVDRARIRSEIFGAGRAMTPGVVAPDARAPHPPDGAAGTGPSVSFARSGVTTRWDPRYGSLLELAEACSVPTRWSCRTGVCHTCESGLLSGGVAYAPDPVEPPADGNLLICCSQPRDDVVLDR